MAFSRRNLMQAAASLLAGFMLAVGAGAAEDQRQQPISLDAASSVVDYKTNTVVFKDIVISQGDIKVQADRARATGLDFDNSRWTFEGNVRINVEHRGNLRSDQAVVEFRNNRIAKATITGNPAEFEQKRADSDQMARGHAREIVYDVNDGTVRLSNDAWLSDGRNEISGQLLVYNIREERVQATGTGQPGSDGRVHITIGPRGNIEPGHPGQSKPDQNKPDQNKPDQNKPDQNKPDPNKPDPNKP
jgi:lipopolysaccharide transport protein LptA